MCHSRPQRDDPGWQHLTCNCQFYLSCTSIGFVSSSPSPCTKGPSASDRALLSHFLCTLTASGLQMEQPGLQKHVTIGKVCALPLRLTLSIQGIATSPLPRLMTALSQNKLKARVRNVHRSLPRISEQHGLTVIFQELWTLGVLFFFFFFRKHKQTNTKTPKQNS